jgi:hypothetical protein
MLSRRVFLSGLGCAATIRAAESDVDILVYGATPGGIAAAISAARAGSRVLLVEPTARIGGMSASGLSHPDFRTFEALSGAFHDFRTRVRAHYTEAYGAKSAQVTDSLEGTHAEPKVVLRIFEQMIAEQPRIRVERNWSLASVQAKDGTLRSAAFRGGRRMNAQMFIDASYEGDLMAAAGVPFRWGREARSETGEPLAPEKADKQLQGYNFRLTATKDPKNRVEVRPPAGYRREEFTGVLPLLANGRIKQIFGYTPDSIYKAQIPKLPNGKYDINDVSNGPVRLSLPGENLEWPTGDAKARQRIFDRHLRWNIGLLWFLQNDEAVPEKFRNEAREWGWCRDEFEDSGHLPPQLYVREARRMEGLRLFTEMDTNHAKGDARAVLQRDSVACCDYGPNCHGTSHEGPLFGGKHTGEFYKQIPPYQIPYSVMLPKKESNLLVPVAASSTHVGFCALRFEPTWMSLGQAAGIAASLAASRKIPVQKVPVAELQRSLWKERLATIYVSDVSPDHADFEAVQWWATNGGLHNLAPTPEPKALRGKNRIGQYFEAFPHHAAELGRALDDELRTRWTALAKELGVDSPPQNARTRGEFITTTAHLRRG